MRGFVWLALAVLLFCIWIGSFLLYHVAGFFIHLLLIFAVISLILHLFSRKRLAASLSSRKKSTPLESSKSSLFLQNTRGGGTSTLLRRASLPPLSPVPSLDCAYFLSPRGCTTPQCPSDLGLHQSGDLPLCLHSPSRAVDAQPGFQ